MAKPRIFVSSTFYDLRYVRNDLERFIFDLGYEPVLHEKGQIAYGKDEPLEKYCHREISNCDVLVNIVGGRYGSESKMDAYSISQMELKTARELHKQIYIFVEKSVHTEYQTYLKNEENENFIPRYVDNVKIYQFLKEVYSFPSNNVIIEFDSVTEMITYLKEQFAGLFQRFLQEESRKEDFKISSNLKSTAETLASIIEYTSKERDETIKTILVNSHPVFDQVKQANSIPFRVFFTNFEELKSLLEAYRYEYTGEDFEDDHSFIRSQGGKKTTLFFPKNLFDKSDRLKPVEHGEWEKEYVRVETENIDEGDDLPF